MNPAMTLTVTVGPDGRISVTGLDATGPTQVADVAELCELLDSRIGGAAGQDGAGEPGADDQGGAPDSDADDQGAPKVRPPVTGAPVDLARPTPGPADQPADDPRAMWDREAAQRGARPTGLMR